MDLLLAGSSTTGVAYDLRPLLAGRWDLMTAQHWGVFAGVVTYTVTVSVVLILLCVGGTFTRLREQSEAYAQKGPAAFAAPYQRFQLYDELLAASVALPKKPVVPVLPPERQAAVGEGGVAGGVAGGRAQRGIRGKYVRLVPYDEQAHLAALWAASNGTAAYAHGPYDPDEALFRFMDDGPFDSAAALGAAPFLAAEADGVRLLVVDAATGYVCGMASLKAHAPRDLRVEIGDVWITPAFQRTHVHRDVLLALLTHLFGANYRRVEWRCDAEDGRARRAAARAGFVLEGVLRKHRIVRRHRHRRPLEPLEPLEPPEPLGGVGANAAELVAEEACGGCNRDTAVFALTNADWRDGARAQLEARLRPPAGISGPTRPRLAL